MKYRNKKKSKETKKGENIIDRANRKHSDFCIQQSDKDNL